MAPDERIFNQFEAGLRVLAVDDDNTVLESIEKACIRYKHHVTRCRDALCALNLVQERKGHFDLILIDVRVPNMDGFELLQRVKQEIDVPVIMMSVDDAPNAVEKSIKYEACDYWVKPLRDDHFKHIWWHVARKVWRENKLHKGFANSEDDNRKESGSDDSEFTSATDATESVFYERKSTSREAVVDESKNSYGRPTKKRVVWTGELHEKFVKAVMQLGNERAMPKRILEVMNEPDLRRQNVASHLQKYRTYLKRCDGEPSHQQKGKALQNSVPRRFDLEASDADGNANNIITEKNQTVLIKSSIECPNLSHAEQQIVAHAHPRNVPNNFSHSIHYPSATISQLNQYHQQPPLMHSQIHSFKSLTMLSGNSASVSETRALLSTQSNNSLLLSNNFMSAPTSISRIVQNPNLTRGVLRSFHTVILPLHETQFSHGSRSRDANDIDSNTEKEEPNSMNTRQKHIR